MSKKNKKKIENAQGGLIVIPAPDVVHNGFGEAMGFGTGIGGGINPTGFSGSGSAYQTVSDTQTAFQNLRWYLVSNFRQLLSQLFVEIGLVKTIVCVPVDDGLRGGVMFKSKQLDEEQVKDLLLTMKRDDDFNIAGWAAKWTRLYGGGGILILVEDQDPETELDIKSIGPDSKVTYRAVDMWELYWDKQNVEGYDAEIQLEEFEFYNYYSKPIHKSRVMRLKGIEAPSFIRPRLRGWGVSVVEDLIRSMNQYLKATDLGFEVLDEFKLDVYKIKNLVNTLLSAGGTNKIKERVQMANWQKNYQNAIVMDAEDDFDHKQLSFAGLAEAMEGIRTQVAADMRIPILKLFGQSFSKGGLGTSSSEEMENYNSMIESEVRGKLEYHILQMAQIKCQQLHGFVPDDLELEFKPLKELSAKDLEEVKNAKYTRLAGAKAAGELTTLEYRDASNKGALFDIQLDTEADGLSEDPQLGEVLSGDAADDASGANDEAAEGDSGDESEKGEPGADKPNTEKVAPKPKLKTKNSLLEKIRPYTPIERIFRLNNSADFDRASYEADGGDSWIVDGRKALFEDPMGIDWALWSEAKKASNRIYHRENWKFITWYYKKLGGKFT